MNEGFRPSRTTPARAVPRNVPMLTEVVGQQRVTTSAPQQRSTAAQTAQTAHVKQVAQAVLAQIEPVLEQRISEAIARVLHEQMLGLNARVCRAVASEVLDAVAAALERMDATTGNAPLPRRG